MGIFQKILGHGRATPAGDDAAARVRGLLEKENVRPADIDALVSAARAEACDAAHLFILLKELLMAKHSRTRSHVVQVLGRLQDQCAVDLLMDAFGDQDARVRSDVAEALGRQADARAIPLLLKAMSDANWQVRESASIALGRFNDPDMIDQLLPSLHNEDPQLRIQMVRTLARIGGEKALPLLLDMLDDGSVDVQSEAIDALAVYRSAAIVPLLRHYHAGDRDLRQRIATACKKIGIARVAAYLADSDADIRIAVAEMLGQYVPAGQADWTLLPLLSDAWHHEADPDVQMRLVIAIGQLAAVAAERSPDAAIKALIDAARYPDQAIAYHGKKALELIHHPLAEQYIQSPLQPSKIAITCPNCLQKLQLTPPLTGKKWECDRCYLGFTIRPGADGILLVSPSTSVPAKPMSDSQTWFDVLQLNASVLTRIDPLLLKKL